MTRIRTGSLLAGMLLTAVTLGAVATGSITQPGTDTIAPVAEVSDGTHITLEMSECGVMAVGTTGTCIVSLQSWLNMVLDEQIWVDGQFGPQTRRAVQQFQLKMHLEPDGHCGDESRNALRDWYEGLNDSSVATPDFTCNTATGDYCDKGEVQPGLHGGVVEAVMCEGVGKLLSGGGVFCSVFFE
jgi:peptidoglycan hydrolase-like protein with peptidoglycan-binding domain